jgi:hypothetical protein
MGQIATRINPLAVQETGIICRRASAQLWDGFFPTLVVYPYSAL